MDQNEIKKAETAKKRLSQMSASFCTVQWKHATVNLGSGSVKSCCHHSFSNIELNPGSEFHDTKSDQNNRKMMLNGQRPKACSVCWWVEDQGHYSDRILWSSKSWMSPSTEEVANHNKPEALSPAWIELNFSNLCNLRCSYCSPIFSTRWLQDIQQKGPYPTNPAYNSIPDLTGVQKNSSFGIDQVETEFWIWFDRVFWNLRLLKVTGGEPLLSESLYKVFELLKTKKNHELVFSINTNLSVPDNVWGKFIEEVSQLIQKKPYKKFYLQASIDTFGTHAEYIRDGLDFNRFQKHVHHYLNTTGGDLIFICTMNNLSLISIKKLWEYLLELKQIYGPRGQWISITTEVLQNPEWQNVNILPEKFQQYLIDTILFAESNKGNSLTQFSDFEISGLHKILDLMKSCQVDKSKSMANFYRFFDSYDKRRNLNFQSTFPEMSEFYEECKRFASV